MAFTGSGYYKNVYNNKSAGNNYIWFIKVLPNIKLKHFLTLY